MNPNRYCLYGITVMLQKELKSLLRKRDQCSDFRVLWDVAGVQDIEDSLDSDRIRREIEHGPAFQVEVKDVLVFRYVVGIVKIYIDTALLELLEVLSGDPVHNQPPFVHVEFELVYEAVYPLCGLEPFLCRIAYDE